MIPGLQAACRRADWTSLVPVQAKAIPYLLAGRDDDPVKNRQRKTGAYLPPIMQKIDPQRNVVLRRWFWCLPVNWHCRWPGSADADRETELRTAVVYGGVGYHAQLEAFRGGAQLVVGTPGRILDHLLKNTLSLDHLKMLIFYEATGCAVHGLLSRHGEDP